MDLPLEALPPALVDPARRAWQALCEADRDCAARAALGDDAGRGAELARVLAASPWAAAQLARRPALLASLATIVASAPLVVGFSAQDSPMTAGLAAGFGALIMVVLLWSLVVWYFRRYWKRVAAENYPNEKNSVYWAGNIATEVNCARLCSKDS